MRLIFTLIVSLLSVVGIAQDSTIYKWSVTSKKIGESSYELKFTTPAAAGWQLYAPGQMVAGEVPTAELVFADSSIEVQRPFGFEGNAVDAKISALENASFKIFEGDASFVFRINIHGAVPAQLLGTMNYTYGKADEFYPLNPFSFNVALEGGVASDA